MSNGQLDMYKASAGSGKTHRLTHKYISFLLAPDAERDAYKHILAVTFTNKATEEMKSRIVKTLHELSQGKGEELEGKSPGEAAAIQKKAREALTAILHDYSNFQVCTIDKFFQQIFRSFARELGSFSNYRVELRDDDVLAHVVDELLSGLDGDDAGGDRVFDIINRFAVDQLRYKSKHGFQEQLLEFAKLFLKEEFKVKASEYKPDLEKMEKVEARAREISSEFESRLRSLAREAVAVINEYYLSFKGGDSIVKKLKAYACGDVPKPSEKSKLFTENQKEMLSGDCAGWFAKTSQKDMLPRAQAACSREPGLDNLLAGIVEMFGNQYSVYHTAVIVRNNIGVMKIFGSIYAALGHYLKENNIMLLGETTQAIGRMIGDSDTPFIYERVGSWIDHYLLDEFQDFSLMQWANFKPLLEQSLDQGCGNLIVGDVKQSIYRWRGSDWNTLDSGVQKELGGRNIVPDTLKDNYRSDKAIVDFNNHIFLSLTNARDGYFDGDETIARAFEDCEQRVKSGKEGHVKFTWYDKPSADEPNPALVAIKGEIEALDALGYPRNAVYVLVRKNAQAAEVAEQLISDGIDVITDESLLVGVSAFVQRIVAVLKYMVNPDDATNRQIMKEMGIDVSAVNIAGNSLYDVCENIVRSLDQDLIKGEMPYLMTFMDLVLDYMRDYGSDMAGFLRWWDDVGSTSAVSSPRGANAVRIMTIHKAKGLGCPVVIVPFFQEELAPKGSQAKYMWCKDSSELDAGLLPVEFSSYANASTFSGDYQREELLYKMDALNTAYVAFTRAKHELIVFANKKDTKCVSGMVYNLLEKEKSLKDDVFEAGERAHYTAGEEDSEGVTPMQLGGYSSIPMEGSGNGRKRLALVYRGSDFFDPEGRDAARRRGIVMHYILSRINTVDDVEPSVDTAIAGGELAASEREDTVARVNDMLQSVTGYGWFRGEGEVLNELSIIDTDGKVHRPDRVVIDGGKVSVIDYKFGTHHGGYRRQVQQYMEMLRRMGYSQVEGYLWYVAENNIEKVA